MSDSRRLLLRVMCSLWVFVFVYALVTILGAVPLAGGFPEGVDRVMVYLGWQGIAGMLAVAVFGIGRGWPRGSSVRGMTTVPLAIASVHVVAVGVFMLWYWVP